MTTLLQGTLGAPPAPEPPPDKPATSTAWIWGVVGLAIAGVVTYELATSTKRNPSTSAKGYYAQGWGSIVGPYAGLEEAKEAFEAGYGDSPQQVVLGRRQGGEVVGKVVWSESRPGDEWEPNPIALYVLTDHKGSFEPFTLPDFAQDNEDIDPHIVAKIGDMKPKQTLRFDVGRGSFGIRRIQ